jgi:hypothetical protein
VSEYDSPWKEAIEWFLQPFLEFFFPDVAWEIDWSRRYESLDKELQQIVREGELGLRLADKLFKVWRLDGEEAWVLIHVEVQNQAEEQFGERMYVYHYRIFDRFRRPVVSLAVLGDEQRSWRPQHFGYSLWGCSMRLEFPVVKLLDYGDRVAELEAERNPFAAVVLAHLKTVETRHRPAQRRDWKVRLVKSLFDRGLSAEEIRQLFRLIDWLMELPREFEEDFQEQIHRFEEERQMPYVTAIERMALEKGLEQGIEQGIERGLQRGELRGLQRGIELALELKFGPDGLQLLPLVRAVSRVEVLRTVEQAIRAGRTLDDVRSLLT